MFDTLLKVKCPNCKKNTYADKHLCGCVFGKCEHCGTDFKFDKSCSNR